MNWLTQIITVTALNLRSIPQRLGSSAVAATGVAGVVVVFLGVLSIAEGFRAALTNGGDDQTVIVLRSGSDTEMTSGFGGDSAKLIVEAPGLERSADGPHASPELFVIVAIPLKRSGTDANVPLRGVTPIALRVRPELKVVQGRMFTAGTNEVMVGRSAAAQFAGLDLGSSFRTGQSVWTVVGVFEANGGVAESEIWSDARVLQPAYQRGNSYQSVYARLESPDTLNTFKDALTADPRLSVTVLREREYFEDQSRVMQTIIKTIGVTIAVLMAVGAIFGAVNTMYTAVASRTREIATLRALGFASFPVVVSVLAEAVLLSLIGGSIGGLLAWLAFDGYQTATMNWQSFSQVAFAFAVTPALLVRGLLYATLMGLIGGLLPAWRAARMPVVTALREL
jgi:putative ABC transport system permease protein